MKMPTEMLIRYIMHVLIQVKQFVATKKKNMAHFYQYNQSWQKWLCVK